MTYAEATQYWTALDDTAKSMFYNIASKSDGNHTAYEWFMHLVPDELKDSPEEVITFMRGGTVVTPEGTMHDIPDRDVSRITSGENGGEYTTDNTIMENSSVNRARGADNMTDSELQQATEANALDADIIDGAEIVEVGGSTTETLTATADGMVVGDVLGTAANCVVAGVAAYKVGEAVYNNLPDDWTEDDKVLATGGAAIGTAALAFTPPGQIALAIYGGWKILEFVGSLMPTHE